MNFVKIIEIILQIYLMAKKKCDIICKNIIMRNESKIEFFLNAFNSNPNLFFEGFLRIALLNHM